MDCKKVFLKRESIYPLVALVLLVLALVLSLLLWGELRAHKEWSPLVHKLVMSGSSIALLLGGWWSYGSRIKAYFRQLPAAYVSDLPFLFLCLSFLAWQLSRSWGWQALAIAIGLALWQSIKKRQFYRPPLIAFWPLLYVLVESLFAIASPYPREALHIIGQHCALLLVPLMACLTRWGERERRLLTSIGIPVLLAYLVLTMTTYFLELPFWTRHWTDILSLAKDYLTDLPENFTVDRVFPSWRLIRLPMTMLWTTGFLLAVRYKVERRFGFLELLAVLLLVLFTFILRVRIGAFYLVIAGLLLFFSSREGLFARYYSLKRMLFALGGVLLLVQLAVATLDAGRIELYQQSFEALEGHEVWGAGVGAGRVIHRIPYNHQHTHNMLLSSYVEMGVVGLLFMLLLFGGLIYRSYRQRDWLLGLFTFFLLLNSLTDSPLYSVQLRVFCIIGLVMLLPYKTKKLKWTR